MGGRHSRDKGARWERELVRILREAGWGAERNLAQVRGGEQEGPDVITQIETSYYPGPWLAIECKSGKNPPFWAALRQAKEGAEALARIRSVPDGFDRYVPVVAIKRDFHKPVILMDLDDFLQILGRVA